MKTKKQITLGLIALTEAALITACSNKAEEVQDVKTSSQDSSQEAVENKAEEKDIVSELTNTGDKYVYMDINKDGQDELIVLSDINLYIYETENKSVIYEGTEYEMPINNSTLVGVLYKRDGGAPTHVDYIFTEFDENYNQSTIEFSYYDLNENGIKDEEDWYLVGEDETDMDEWVQTYSIYEECADTSVNWNVAK